MKKNTIDIITSFLIIEAVCSYKLTNYNRNILFNPNPLYVTHYVVLQ